MSALVTGGAGFVGGHLVRLLMARSDEQIVVLDKMGYAATRAVLDEHAASPRFTFTQVDLADAEATRAAVFEAAPRVVFHLAAESHVDRSIDAPRAFLDSNVVGTFNLLAGAQAYWTGLSPAKRDAFRFIHVSTDEVFGALGDEGVFDENAPYRPRSPYAASKAASDHFARAWGHTYGLPVIVTNCANNYGSHQFPEKLIPRSVIRALRGETIELYGRGENVRDWLHVADHAEALRLAAARGTPGATYLIGGVGGERTNRAVIDAVCDALDAVKPRAGGSHHDLLRFIPDRPGHDFRYAVDGRRFAETCGWAPRHDFESGLRDTVRWYAENEDWWRGIEARATERQGGSS